MRALWKVDHVTVSCAAHVQPSCAPALNCLCCGFSRSRRGRGTGDHATTTRVASAKQWEFVPPVGQEWIGEKTSMDLGDLREEIRQLEAEIAPLQARLELRRIQEKLLVEHQESKTGGNELRIFQPDACAFDCGCCSSQAQRAGKKNSGDATPSASA